MREARAMLAGCLAYLQEHGQLCELFDGDPPHHPAGAIGSARSVAEILRSYVEDVLGVFEGGRIQPRAEVFPDALREGGRVRSGE